MPAGPAVLVQALRHDCRRQAHTQPVRVLSDRHKQTPRSADTPHSAFTQTNATLGFVLEVGVCALQGLPSLLQKALADRNPSFRVCRVSGSLKRSLRATSVFDKLSPEAEMLARAAVTRQRLGVEQHQQRHCSLYQDGSGVLPDSLSACTHGNAQILACSSRVRFERFVRCEVQTGMELKPLCFSAVPVLRNHFCMINQLSSIYLNLGRAVQSGSRVKFEKK